MTILDAEFDVAVVVLGAGRFKDVSEGGNIAVGIDDRVLLRFNEASTVVVAARPPIDALGIDSLLNIACRFVNLLAVSSDIPPPTDAFPTLSITTSAVVVDNTGPARWGIIDFGFEVVGGRAIEGTPVNFEGSAADTGDDKVTVDLGWENEAGKTNGERDICTLVTLLVGRSGLRMPAVDTAFFRPESVVADVRRLDGDRDIIDFLGLRKSISSSSDPSFRPC
jgi:hypothetical protein